MSCVICGKPTDGGTYAGFPCCFECYTNRPDDVLAYEARKNRPEPGSGAMAHPMSFSTGIQLWADGACSGNPGPGGWGFVLVHLPTGTTKEHSGAVDNATNNRMELLAIEQGLLAIRKPRQWVTVYTDSLGAINWLTGRWKIKDREIARLAGNIKALVAEMSLNVAYRHVDGHTGVALNERANKLAQTQARRRRADLAARDRSHAPGFVVQRWAENQGVHVP